MPIISSTGQTPQSRQQQINYYAQFLPHGTYQGNLTHYKGMTWSQLYIAIAASNGNASPLALANAVLGVWSAQTLGRNTAAAETGLGKFIKSTEAAAASTNFAAGVPIPDVLGFLTSGAFWVRIGEVMIGLALITVGMVKLAETSKAAMAIIGNAPVPSVRLAKRFVK